MIRTSLILVPLLVISGTVYLLDWLGVIKVSRYAAKVPVVGKWVYQDKDVKKTNAKPKPDPLLMENKKLLGQIKELETKLTELSAKSKMDKAAQERQKRQLEEEILNLKEAAQAAEETKKEKAIKDAGYDKLALYYGQMKPKNAVAIMDKLDVQTVIGILDRLDEEQAAKILSAMDPERAAKIVKLMSN